MTTPLPLSVSVADLQTFMGANVPVETSRGALLVSLVEDIALAYCAPLYMNARGVILSVAARTYANPSQVTTESVGGLSSTMPFPGLYFTKAERTILKTLSGRGGAFSVNIEAKDGSVGQLYPWDYNMWWFGDSMPAMFADPGEMGMWY